MPETAGVSTVHDAAEEKLDPGAGLCLSGGGYRAMLFHVGCIWRLNELNMLGTLKRVSSVSGGSLTSGVLGMNWAALGLSPQKPSAAPELFTKLFVEPLRKMATTTIDEGAVFGGIFLPGSIADHVADKYDSILFQGRTLQDLPSDDAGPRFVINATNVQSGVLMRFSKPFMRDFRVGQVLNPKLPLARAVGASSAFPPILSPAEIDCEKYGLRFEPPNPQDAAEDLNKEPYTKKLILSDGGVYDNMGLETVWKSFETVLVSDAGGHYKPEPDPHHDWARHVYRVLDLIDSQVRKLHARQLMDLYKSKRRKGCFWGIREDIAVYENPPALSCPLVRTTELAETSTRLHKMDDTLQERLINWGYAICDAAIRKFVNTGAPKPAQFPYPASGV